MHTRELLSAATERRGHVTGPPLGLRAARPPALSSCPSPSSLSAVADWSIGLVTKQNTQVKCPFININGLSEKIMWGLRVFCHDPEEVVIQIKWGNATDVGHGCRSNPII